MPDEHHFPKERRIKTRLIIPLSRVPLDAKAVEMVLKRWLDRARSVYPEGSPEVVGVKQVLALGTFHPELLTALGAIAEQITYDELIA